MSGNKGLIMVRNAVKKKLQDFETGRFRGVLNGPIYTAYKRAQDERFRTENSSEGSHWKQVKRDTRIRKIKDRQRDSSRWPGGDRILIHTGDLSRSVIGTRREHHRKVVTERAITIATTLAYAGFVAEKRPFMKFGSKTKGVFKSIIRRHVRDLMAGRKV